MRLTLRARKSDLLKQFVFILCLTVFHSGFNTVNASTPSNTTLQIGNSKIEIVISQDVGGDNYSVNHAQIIEWIERSANAVADYFQRFPVKSLKILVNSGAGRRVDGTAYHGEEPLIISSINETMTSEFLRNDWVMVHEMVHLSFPPVYRRHNWLLEGLATYVEPIVRVRAGIMKEDKAWLWLIKGTPQGLPKAGDKGLDNTPTWGRTYWGGAVFFLLADIQIHQQTKNKFGIEHALRAIQKAGGSMQLESNWQVSKALAIGDKATGTHVLMTLYNSMKNQAVMTDLEKIWKQLGVSIRGNKVNYNNKASQADLRQTLILK